MLLYLNICTGSMIDDILIIHNPGPIVVKERQYERTDPDVLERYGGGDIWPPAAAWELGERMSNNNFYESDEMGVSHGVCGDTPQVVL